MTASPDRAFSRVALTALSAAVLLAAPLSAQDAEPTPPRPRLPAAADTNDWGQYFDLGVDMLKRRNGDFAAAFYWASRLNPERAEPLFARWVAFHLSDYDRWTRYLDRDARVLRDPVVLRADSLRLRAYLRNPFVPQTLEVLLYDQLPGTWRRTDLTRGLLAYSERNFPRALEHWGRAIKKDPVRFAGARRMRAEVFVLLARYDSALAELVALRAQLAREDSLELVREYQSKALLDYAIGLLHGVLGNQQAGREAMGDALAENLAFYPAHVFLGDQALRAGDVSTAVREYEAARELESADAALWYRYGLALSRAGRTADARQALERAVELEPFYAAPWLALGRSRQAAGDHAGARAALERFIALAPRSDTAPVAEARRRLAALDSP